MKIIPKIWIIIFISFLFQYQLLSQVITIKGKIIDKTTGEGIPYANVGIPVYSIGTSANEDGDFIIKIPSEHEKDTLFFSSVGYSSYKTPISKIRKEEKAIIALSSSEIKLDEFTFKIIDASKIIKKLLAERTNNYATEPALVQLFCREILKENETNRFFLQAEGILEMYKSSVKKDDDQVRLVKGRKKNLSLQFEYNSKMYAVPEIVNGPTSGIILDIVKNKKFFILQNNQFLFTHEGYEVINDRPMYVINFVPKDTSRRILYPDDFDFYKGKIYVDKESYTLTRAVFSLSQRGINVANLEPKYGAESPLLLEKRDFIVDYSQFKDKWYFKSAIVENIYKHNFITLHSKIELFTTRIKTDSVKSFPKKQLISNDEMLATKINNFDDSFWEDYNFIKSTEEIKNEDKNEVEMTTNRPSQSAPVETIKSIPLPKLRANASQIPLSSKEVHFFEGTFEAAQKAATEQNKFIFIDVFTDWCMPCKAMARDAFQNRDIADRMNTFFINFKANAESSGRFIANKYNVRAYPTVLIINPKGDLVSSFTGYSGASLFSAQIAGIIKTREYGNTFLRAQELFNDGNRKFDLLTTFARMRKALGISNEIITDAIITDLPKDSLAAMHFKQFIMTYSHDLDSKTFDYILKNRNEPIYEVKLKNLLQVQILEAAAAKDKNYLKRILNANARIETDPSVLEERNAELTLEYYRKSKNDKEYHKSAIDLLSKHYYPQFISAQTDKKEGLTKELPNKILKIAHHYALEIKDKDSIIEIMNWVQKISDLKESAELLSAYSQLLYRNSDKIKAQELMRKAVSLTDNDRIMNDILNKMEKNEF